MKSTAKAPLFFSAYPLKAVEKQMTTPAVSQHASPYLRAVLAGSRKSATHLRVYPMQNPYNDRPEPVSKRLQPPAPVHLEEREWLTQYE